MYLLLIILIGAGGWIIVTIIRRTIRRVRLAHQQREPFPAEWEKALRKNLVPYQRLDREALEQLHNLIRVFLYDKSIEACGGLELTDEIRVTIAAQACLLLLHRDTKCYARLRSVLVYPGSYVAGQKGIFGRDGERSVRLGESWNTGVVVLSWDDVQHGGRDFKDGHNVTLHEFAHQLDQEDGSADGAPILEQRSNYVAWARVLNRDYKTLQKRANKGRKDVMDRYGATNPAEFFAVATETFFEKPRQLKDKHPELFEELLLYYKTNPLEWIDDKAKQ